MLDAQRVQMSTRAAGKLWAEHTYTVSAHGKTMHVVDDDKLHGTTLTYTADKKAL